MSTLLSTFRKRLRESAEGRGITAGTWSSRGRNSANLMELSTSPKTTVLYVKEFNPAGPGFWGLTQNQVNRLVKADVRWFAVLLLRSCAAGYVLTAAEVDGLIGDGSFELSGDGDYKVNETLDLNTAQAFHSFSELLDRVV